MLKPFLFLRGQYSKDLASVKDILNQEYRNMALLLIIRRSCIYYDFEVKHLRQNG